MNGLPSMISGIASTLRRQVPRNLPPNKLVQGEHLNEVLEMMRSLPGLGHVQLTIPRWCPCTTTSATRDESFYRWRYATQPQRVTGEYSISANHSFNFTRIYNLEEWANPLNVKVPVPNQTPVGVWISTYYDGTEQRDIGVFNRAVPEIVPVTLAVDGGADGNAGTAPTYTYTVTHTTTGTQLGTTISPTMQRVWGAIVPATIGMARTGHTTVQLYWCDEVPEIAGCGV